MNNFVLIKKETFLSSLENRLNCDLILIESLLDKDCKIVYFDSNGKYLGESLSLWVPNE